MSPGISFFSIGRQKNCWRTQGIKVELPFAFYSIPIQERQITEAFASVSPSCPFLAPQNIREIKRRMSGIMYKSLFIQCLFYIRFCTLSRKKLAMRKEIREKP